MRFLAICLMLLCPVLSSAQDVRKVNCRFVCCGGTAPPPPLINAFDKDIEVTCTIPTNTFSEPVECCAKSNVISFLSSERRKPMASAKIPEQVKAAILVFIPAGKSRISPMAVPLSPTSALRMSASLSVKKLSSSSPAPITVSPAPQLATPSTWPP